MEQWICMPLTAQQPIRSSLSQESEKGKFLDSKLIQKEKGKETHIWSLQVINNFL